jgi:hypothetical protein
MKFRCIFLNSHKLYSYECGTYLVEGLLQMPAFCRLLSQKAVKEAKVHPVRCHEGTEGE